MLSFPSWTALPRYSNVVLEPLIAEPRIQDLQDYTWHSGGMGHNHTAHNNKIKNYKSPENRKNNRENEENRKLEEERGCKRKHSQERGVSENMRTYRFSRSSKTRVIGQ